ncbi:hypothetical protein JRO89_XS12G0223500 [Xanthoceras sorbifolium]|uniref:Protein RIK n=1 Tax=Xanthoceras sorbifolium TaxID=99658 RepID=A0ABQ8HDA2_9ROSI|nr:hypothetical protein JRO89_XS12G0223500 [Xanthoceras sorbifolium]
MTEDSGPRVSSDDSAVSTDASQTRQRKKRKWDQPAESLLNYPLGSMVALQGSSILSLAIVYIEMVLLLGNLKVKKIGHPKIQDELVIAREIIINDAESSLRYKLTKRQTQEEIQKCTGAVVITRGKYRPPNAPPDGEKPLYLHISAAAYLKETAERIIAVDRAAAMVEEMLQQGQNSHTSYPPLQTVMNNGVKAMSTCVYLGFDADPSLNIVTRIRGPNDQYINHIMNETGATVMLKGRGSGTFEGPLGEEVQQPLHLFLSSNNPKSLEDAKRLAENLLDTISVECGASRAPSCKVYNAVPPPQQLLTGVQSSGNEQRVNADLAAGLTSTVSITPAPLIPSVTAAGIATVYSQAALTQSGGTLNCAQPQPNLVGYSQPILSGGTSYSGYEGIYPQATPLQQVALALRQSTSPITYAVAPTTSVASTATKSNVNYSSEKEKRPPQKRKFQELPVGSKGPAKLNQVSLSKFELVCEGVNQLLYITIFLATLALPSTASELSFIGIYAYFLAPYNLTGLGLVGSLVAQNVRERGREWKMVYLKGNQQLDTSITRMRKWLMWGSGELRKGNYTSIPIPGSELPKPSEPSTDFDVRNVSNMPAPKKLVKTFSNGMPPLPPRSMPPPPPPKFASSPPATNSHDKKSSLNKTKSDNVPDTLVKLMEYGDDDDDDDEDDDPEETSEASFSSDSSFSVNSSKVAVRKPFWAL